jgi:hypothetical protein
MSFTSIRNDNCALLNKVKDSQAIIDYTLNDNAIFHGSQCMNMGNFLSNDRKLTSGSQSSPSGIPGGSIVNKPSFSLVDVESELRGQSRKLSLCQGAQYVPQCLDNCPRGATNALPACVPSRNGVKNVGFNLNYNGKCSFPTFN